ncbi:hypothetical protein GOODEAATRI_011715 [Goodea atripinnis]|uniref:NEDD4 binding protein 3 n=1 Tax=Goodea atripinnis TaxID=208336 RepID=A0ABV0PMT2_9TELE
MAASVQTLPLTRGPSQNFRSPFPTSPLSSHCGMGSVGSLVEKPDVSPTKGNHAVPQVRPRQTNGLLKKGLTQRELLNYLNITRWELLQSSRYFFRMFHEMSSDLLCFRTEKSPKQVQAATAKGTLSEAGKRMKLMPNASMGHINTIGSLDRTSQGLKAAGSGGVAMGEVACRSMATLNRLTPYGSEAPPPYEWMLSLSVEDVVRDLEERLVEKEHELKQMRRNLDESEGAIAQVCQKSGEISLLKQQLRDSQAEVTQKLSEIFKLKTQLRETRMELRNREAQIDALKLILQGTQRGRCSSAGESMKEAEESPSVGATGGSGGPTEERLRAELLLERRQSEAQTMAFEEERHTWQTEKDKVIRYQKELQASYLEMYHRNEALEKELQQLRAGGAREGRGTGEGGESRDGTLEREAPELTAERAAGNPQEAPSSSLPWIERIESSEI